MALADDMFGSAALADDITTKWRHASHGKSEFEFEFELLVPKCSGRILRIWPFWFVGKRYRDAGPKCGQMEFSPTGEAHTRMLWVAGWVDGTWPPQGPTPVYKCVMEWVDVTWTPQGPIPG